MPYRRNRLKRRNQGRRPLRRRMVKSRSVYKAPMTAYKVQRIVGAELKRTVIGISGSAPGLVGEFQAITPFITQGDTATQRNGNWIQPIVMHGTVQVNALHAGTLSVVLVRFFFFRWLEDANINDAEVLDKLVNSTVDPNGQFNFENRGQFKILYTRNFSVVSKDNNPQFTKQFKYYIKLNRGQRVLYGDVGVPKKFQIYFAIFSNTATVDSIPEYTLNNVMRFTDS